MSPGVQRVPARARAWRPALRLARREAARSPGRTALLVLMIALPVLAASTLSVVLRSQDLEVRDQVQVELGNVAEARLDDTGSGYILGGLGYVTVPVEPDQPGTGSAAPAKSENRADLRARIAAALPPEARLVESHTRLGGARLALPEGPLPVEITELDLADPGVAGLVRTVAGRPPRSGTEVGVTAALARRAGLVPGDEVRLAVSPPGGGASIRRSFTVSQVVNAPVRYGDVIVRPGTLPPAPSSAAEVTSWYVIGTPVTLAMARELVGLDLLVTSRALMLDPPPGTDTPPNVSGPVGLESVTIAGVAIGLVLLQMILLAGPAMAVTARRKRRDLALVAAAGGDPAHQRSVVLAYGLVTGIGASAAAAVAGAGLGAVLVAWLARRGTLVAPRVDVHPGDLVGLTLVGTLTAVAAALIPAVQAARVGVVAGLGADRGQGPPPPRVPALGLLLAVAGAALSLWGGSESRATPVVLGIGLGEVGLVMATGAVVALLARAARRLSAAPRLAVRDAARHRGRTAPAVAAVVAAVAGGVAASVYLGSADAQAEAGFPSIAVPGTVLALADEIDQPESWDGIAAALRAQVDLAAVAPVRTVSPDDEGFLRFSYVEAPQCTDVDPPADPAQCSPGQGTSSLELLGIQSGALVDDGAAYAAITGRRDEGVARALREGKVVVSDPRAVWPGGTVRLTMSRSTPGAELRGTTTIALPAHLDLSQRSMTPIILPPSTATRFGERVVQIGLVATPRDSLDDDAESRVIAAVHQASDGVVSASIASEYRADRTALLLLLAIAASVALAASLGAVALAAAESRADLATMAAVGAGPRTRRGLAAAQAGVVAGLGAVLGLAGGLLSGGALVLFEWQTLAVLVLPWGDLALLGAGVPLVVVAVAWLATPSRVPLTRRPA